MTHMCSFKWQKADILIHMNKSEHITHENGYIYQPFKNIQHSLLSFIIKMATKNFNGKKQWKSWVFQPNARCSVSPWQQRSGQHQPTSPLKSSCENRLQVGFKAYLFKLPKSSQKVCEGVQSSSELDGQLNHSNLFSMSTGSVTTSHNYEKKSHVLV